MIGVDSPCGGLSFETRAQLAITHDALLLHCDRDFETIATVSDLRHRHTRFLA